jgi:hypothetical protein
VPLLLLTAVALADAPLLRTCAVPVVESITPQGQAGQCIQGTAGGALREHSLCIGRLAGRSGKQVGREIRQAGWQVENAPC